MKCNISNIYFFIHCVVGSAVTFSFGINKVNTIKSMLVERSLLSSPRLHAFDKKCCKTGILLNMNVILNMYSILIQFKI